MLKTIILPPNVSEQDFSRAIDSMGDVIGKRYVVTDSTVLSKYLDPYPLLEETYFAPSAVVYPDSAEEVQELVKVANVYGVPLSPISTGKNNGYGGAAPRLPGSIIVDMKRMNRIIEVNEKFGYALVEPGVSYFDLYNYLQEKNIKLWMDVPDLGWGSIVGNALDRGVGYTPYGDHLQMQCGMEVVLGNGELVRTGMGAVPGNNTWQLFKYGFGPYQDGIFSQSNYGIVTKMGIWLMPEPPGYRPFMITFPREEDLGQFVEILRPLRLNQIIQNAPTLRNVLLDAAGNIKRKDYYSGEGAIPDSILKKIMKDQQLGYWNFYGALYGPEILMDANWTIIRDAFSQIPGAKFYRPEDRPGRLGHVINGRAKIMKGVPNMDELEIMNFIDNGAHAGFSPVSPVTGEDALRQYEMVRKML